MTRKSVATVNRAEDAIVNWRCDKAKEMMITGRNEDGSKQTLDKIIDKVRGRWMKDETIKNLGVIEEIWRRRKNTRGTDTQQIHCVIGENMKANGTNLGRCTNRDFKDRDLYV